MTLDEVLQTVSGSTVADWLGMEVRTVAGWEVGRRNEQDFIEPRSHVKLFVYRPEIDISLAMGAPVMEELRRAFVQRFPHRYAFYVTVDLRYRGAVVFEWACFVWGEGGSRLMPMPDPVQRAVDRVYQVKRGSLPLARLFFLLYEAGRFQDGLESAFEDAGIQVVD